MMAVSQDPTKPSYLGLLGKGISHSLSPRLHHFAAQKLGIACRYLLLDSAAGQWPDAAFFSSAFDLGFQGFNVTVPFKSEAARMFAPELGSVNTLYRDEQGWKACSTDADGFFLGLKEDNIDWEGFASVILLGNGGAARALYEALAARLSVPLFVLRRNEKHDAAWPKYRDREISFAQLDAHNLSTIIKRYPESLLIQTTSGPLLGDDLSYLLPSLRGFQGAVSDLVYGPKTSALLSFAKQLQIPHQDGLSMLAGQGILSQKLWWGRSLSFRDARACLAE